MSETWVEQQRETGKGRRKTRKVIGIHSTRGPLQLFSRGCAAVRPAECCTCEWRERAGRRDGCARRCDAASQGRDNDPLNSPIVVARRTGHMGLGQHRAATRHLPAPDTCPTPPKTTTTYIRSLPWLGFSVRGQGK